MNEKIGIPQRNNRNMKSEISLITAKKVFFYADVKLSSEEKYSSASLM